MSNKAAPVIPAKAQAAYYLGFLSAIEGICQKLEIEAAKVRQKLEQLQNEKKPPP